MKNLADMRADFEAKRQAFRNLVASEFPSRGEWDWYRACDQAKGKIGRPNDDPSQDAALVASVAIRAAHDTYLASLHAFYRARDGENGFLGSRS